VARIPRTTNPPPNRSTWWRWLLWLLFRAPGSGAIWLAYMYPGRGKVLASGRRFREPFIEFLYTLTIYAVLAPIGYFVWFVNTHNPPDRAVYGIRSTYSQRAR
jgi:hypothetical protein